MEVQILRAIAKELIEHEKRELFGNHLNNAANRLEALQAAVDNYCDNVAKKGIGNHIEDIKALFDLRSKKNEHSHKEM